jgi:hypothetical protein
VFEACGYAPRLEHPLVKEFLASNSEGLEDKLDDEELPKLEAATVEFAAVNPEPAVMKGVPKPVAVVTTTDGSTEH